MRILLSTTSFQDTPGKHHELLAASGFEVVHARGPLDEAQMMKLIQDGPGFDGFLNGDDAINARVIDAALPRLKVISKYGIGLDSIDVKHATEKRIPVLYTPGVNHTTVAEHTFGLMIAVAKNFWPHVKSTKAGGWHRITGKELANKKLAVLGLGRIGKEVVKRAAAFDMELIGFGHHWDDAFAAEHHLQRAATIEDAIKDADFISLHMHVTPEYRHFVNKAFLGKLKKGTILVNTARGALIDEADVAAACRSGQLFGYGADVLETEPQKSPHIFQDIDNIIITPHVGSRTFESVQRQAVRSVQNTVQFLTGGKDFIQANTF